MKSSISTKDTFAVTAIIILSFMGSIVKAQDTTVNKSQQSEPNVVINKEMIERFNQCDTEGKLISWSDLVLGFDRENLSNLYLAYQNADLDKQSLEDIKLALEHTQTEHLNNSNIDNDLAWFNQVKQAINNKLRTADMVVQK